MADDKDNAPNCANPKGLNLGDQNYPKIDNMEPQSYGKIQSSYNQKFVYVPSSQHPKASRNPVKHQYASPDLLGKMKLRK